MKRATVLLLFLVPTMAMAGKRADRAHEANGRWEQCVVDFTRGKVSSSERIETVVVAGFGTCREQGDQFRLALREWLKGPGLIPPPNDELERQFQVEKQRIYETAIAAGLASK